MTEELWLAQAKEGNQRAFKALYEIHATPLYRFLRQFTSDTEEVEEWTQRAFIKAFEHLASFDGRSRFSSWLFKLGLNEMRTDRRRDSIVPMVSIDDGASPVDNDKSEQLEWRATMRAWLEELDETKRMVFLLYEVEGYSHAEIASMLEIGESTSRTILTRTKQLLRVRWKKEENAR